MDDDALIRAAAVAAAGLDVFQGEPNLNSAYLEPKCLFAAAHRQCHGGNAIPCFCCLGPRSVLQRTTARTRSLPEVGALGSITDLVAFRLE